MIVRILGMAGAIFALASCNSLPYKDDVGFLVSAQANSPEFPVYINGKLCTDMEGFVGLCSKRIRSTEDVTFKFDPQSYPYLLTVSCTQGVTPVPPATVPAGDRFTFTIKAEDFSQFRSFTCIGEVGPQDRSPPISAKFRVTFVVVDSEYVQRERIYLKKDGKKNYVVLGQHAKDSWVKDSNGWHRFKKMTFVQVFGDPSNVKAYSQSYAMRMNYLNMGVDDNGVD